MRTRLTALPLLLALSLIGASAAHAAPACPDGVVRSSVSDFVGMSAEDVFHGEAAYRRCQLNVQASHNVGLVRQVLHWSLVEREDAPGTFDFASFDRFVLDAAAHGIRVLPILYDPPAFRSTQPARPRPATVYPPRQPSAFAAFARAAVERYGPEGTLWSDFPDAPKLPIRSWQVWNEPNLRAFWGHRPNARSYAAHLKAVSAAIKHADPRAEVVLGGLPNSRYGIYLAPYLTKLYKLGAKRWFDTLAIHPYRSRHATIAGSLRSVRALMNRFRDRRAPIWVTEIGWADRGPRSFFTVGAKRQAKEIAGALKLLGKLRKRYRLRGVVYYNWRDAKAVWRSDYWGFHTGLLRVNGTAKPALGAFRRAAWPLRRAGRF